MSRAYCICETGAMVECNHHNTADGVLRQVESLLKADATHIAITDDRGGSGSWVVEFTFDCTPRAQSC